MTVVLSITKIKHLVLDQFHKLMSLFRNSFRGI